MKATGWIRVSRSKRCPCCDKADYCTISDDGARVHCMRVESAKPAKGSLGGWIHQLATAVSMPRSLPRAEQPRPDIDFHAEARRMYQHKRASQTRTDLAAQLGVSVEALNRLGVGFGADKREYSSWPERGIDGKVVGIVTRYQDGSKKMVRWSRHGLYFTPNWRESTDLVLCPEGGSDVAACLTMGLFAIGRPSNLGGVDLLIAKLKQIKPLRVIVLGERDDEPEKRGNPKTPSCPLACKGCAICTPGRYGMTATAARIRAALRRIEVQARLPPAKDVRAWLNERRGHGDLAGAFLKGLVFA
jgi:hypothetical protein